MKTLVSCFVLAACQLCLAVGDTNIIARSDWSKPVYLQNDHGHDIAIRGRLLILQGREPAYGGPTTTNGAMTFVELQNATESCCGSVDVYFAVTNLHCELSDASGKAVHRPYGSGWSGRGPFSPAWINLPYNSRIRLFVNGGSMNPLILYPGGEPWAYWSIPRNDTNTYFLSGTLKLSTHTNLSMPPELRGKFSTATLEFPKLGITASGIGNRKETN